MPSSDTPPTADDNVLQIVIIVLLVVLIIAGTVGTIVIYLQIRLLRFVMSMFKILGQCFLTLFWCAMGHFLLCLGDPPQEKMNRFINCRIVNECFISKWPTCASWLYIDPVFCKNTPIRLLYVYIVYMFYKTTTSAFIYAAARSLHNVCVINNCTCSPVVTNCGID